MAKVVAVFVSMAGVVMTTLGKTWAADESQMSTARYILCVGCSLLWLTRDIHISFYAFFKFYFRTLNLILGRISYNSSSFLYHISHQWLIAFISENQSSTLCSNGKRSLAGDLFGLLSAMTYGLFTGIVGSVCSCIFGVSPNWLWITRLTRNTKHEQCSASQKVCRRGRGRSWCSKAVWICWTVYTCSFVVAW